MVEHGLDAKSLSDVFDPNAAQGGILLHDGGQYANLAKGADKQILISNGTTMAWKTISGDITILNTGVVAIGAGKVTNSMLAGSIAFSKLVALTASRALESNGSGEIIASVITSAKLGFLTDVTSNIQAQIDGKAASVHTHVKADITDTPWLYADLTLTNSIVNADLTTGVFGAITGIGTQAQNLNMGGFKIIDLGGTGSQTVDAINLTNNQQIGWENSGGTANIGIKIDANDDFIINSQQLLLSKTTQTLRFVMNRDEILGAGTNLGSFRARSFNAASASKNYAQIFFRVEDNTAGGEDGSIKFNTLIAGSSVDSIIINDAGNGLIDFFRDLDMNNNDILIGSGSLLTTNYNIFESSNILRIITRLGSNLPSAIHLIDDGTATTSSMTLYPAGSTANEGFSISANASATAHRITSFAGVGTLRSIFLRMEALTLQSWNTDNTIDFFGDVDFNNKNLNNAVLGTTLDASIENIINISTADFNNLSGANPTIAAANSAQKKFNIGASETNFNSTIDEVNRLRLVHDVTTPVDNSQVHEIEFLADDNLGASVVFAQIVHIVRDVTSTTKDASIAVEVMSNNSMTRFIEYHGGNNDIDIFRDLDMAADILMGGNDIILDAAGNIRLDNGTANVTKLKHSSNFPNFALLRDQIVADGSTAAKISFRSKDSSANERVFGEIRTIIEDTTVAGNLVHGSLYIRVMDANIETTYISFNAAKSGQIEILKNLDISTKNIVTDTTTGTKLGTSNLQKLGIWNAIPIVQPAHIVDADGTLADITTKFNTLLAQHASIGLQIAS